jgi:hypothetical protein
MNIPGPLLGDGALPAGLAPARVKDMLDLASHIVKTKAGRFDPEKFEDQYEDALKELLKRKQEGEPIERPERPKPTNVINLMDALRRSVEASGTSAPCPFDGATGPEFGSPALALDRIRRFDRPSVAGVIV